MGYVALVIMSTFLAVILKNYASDSQLTDYYAFEGACDKDPCIKNSIVYRFSLLNVLFFGGMAIFAPACQMLHLQMWALKLPIYFGLMICVFMFENESFNDYEEVARVFSIIFLFLQVLLLLEFSFDMDARLIAAANKADEDRNLDPEDGCAGYCKNWIRILYIAMLVFIWGSTIGLWIAMYTQFDCSFGQAMTSVVLISTLAMQVVGNVAGTLMASSSETGEAGQGMLPCAVGGLYSTWLTFSALTSNPDSDCNPFAEGDSSTGGLWIGITFSAISIGYMGYSFSEGFLATFNCCSKGGCCQEVGDLCCYEDPESTAPIAKKTEDLHSVAAGDVEAARSDGKASMSRDADSTEATQALTPAGKCGKAGFQRLIFHLTMMTCGFYMAMVLTNWAKQPKDNDWDEDNTDLNTSDESMWIKLASMFLTLALYTWVITAPFLFPDRDFGSAAS